MWRPLRTFLSKADLWHYQRRIKKALALHLRGEARRDGLTVDTVSSHLEIRWRARDIHPWDRDLAQYQKEVLFAEQALVDTEAAVSRLFERLPEVDVIHLSVLEPKSEAVIAGGTVHRSAVYAARRHLFSTGMRLREIGVQYRFATPGTPDSTGNAPIGDWCTR
jgi:hypothetical protein